MNYKEIVEKGFKYSTESPLTYTQAELVEKLKEFDIQIARPTMSNMFRKKERVSIRTWRKAAEGFQILLKKECGMIYDESKKDFIQAENFPKNEIKAIGTYRNKEEEVNFYARGRLRIEDKVEFISTGKHEIFEVGIGLRTFTSYFYNHASYEYQVHIERLLAKGVNIKCLLLNPMAHTTKVYLEDRNELKTIESIENSIFKLTALSKSFQEKGLKGIFSVLTYSHIPYNHFCVIDADRPNGKMIVSPYIFGVKRADAPVYEFTKKEHPRLFERYWSSLQQILKNAETVNLS